MVILDHDVQLNAASGAGANKINCAQDIMNQFSQETFPLSCFSMNRGEKDDPRHRTIYLIHCRGKLPSSFFYRTSTMFLDAFDKVD